MTRAYRQETKCMMREDTEVRKGVQRNNITHRLRNHSTIGIMELRQYQGWDIRYGDGTELPGCGFLSMFLFSVSDVCRLKVVTFL